MKAILMLMEMPKKCYDCQLMSDDMYCKAYIPKNGITKRCVEDDVMHGTRHIYCPLIEINDNIARLIEVAR